MRATGTAAAARMAIEVDVRVAAPERPPIGPGYKRNCRPRERRVQNGRYAEPSSIAEGHPQAVVADDSDEQRDRVRSVRMAERMGESLNGA
jgi:hypothetical protein